MTETREAQIVRAFVDAAGSLVSGYDVVELLDGLTRDCARLLDVSATGLLLADRRGVLHVMAVTSELAKQLELFQLQRHEGPCLDAFRLREVVAVPDIEAAKGRWPAFSPAAQRAGFASVHAVPLRLQETALGALGLFGAEVGSLNDADLLLGQALADVASIALVQQRAASDGMTLTQQLQEALNSRVTIEQAKGVLAQLGGLEMADAFAAMRRYARNHNLRLGAVADAVVQRALPAQELLDSVRTSRS